MFDCTCWTGSKIDESALQGGKNVPIRREKSVHDAKLKEALLRGVVGAIC